MPEVFQQFSEGKMTTVQWREFAEQKAHRGRHWKMMGKEPYVRGILKYFLQERGRVNRFQERAQEEKRAGLPGQWQLESKAKTKLGASTTW